jgi:hypothetical protein
MKSTVPALEISTRGLQNSKILELTVLGTAPQVTVGSEPMPLKSSSTFNGLIAYVIHSSMRVVFSRVEGSGIALMFWTIRSYLYHWG